MESSSDEPSMEIAAAQAAMSFALTVTLWVYPVRADSSTAKLDNHERLRPMKVASVSVAVAILLFLPRN